MPGEAAVEAIIGKCSTLTPAEARTFLTDGWVLVKGAFPRGLAAEIVAESWRELIEDYGIDRNDPRTWEDHPYVRTGDQPHVHIMAERGDKAAQAQLAASRPPKLCDVAPRALGAILDVVAGNVKDAQALELPRSLAVNLSTKNSSKNKDGAPGWQPPNAESPGWHKDGYQYRHFLDSPEQGLLLGYFYDEVLPESGGTQIVPDSIPTVARFLAQHPEGIHPDIAQGAVLNPLLQAELGTGGRFAELTGEAGDLAIMHPYMMHRAAPNPSGRARFAQFPGVLLREPMNFARSDPTEYSLAELVTLQALGLERLDFAAQVAAANAVRELVTPPPARDELVRQREAERVDAEKRRLRAAHPLLANL